MNTSTARDRLLVLVADDDDDIRAVVVDALRADGCMTVEARDGEEVLDLLRRAQVDPSLGPDVLLLDVKMPKLSGLGVLEILRVAKSSMPVVLITAVSDESIHKVAKRLGAVGLLRKPFGAGDMLLAVRDAKATSDLSTARAH
jgi:two-component system response regulator AtoC